jgi:hypothetical protein
MSVLNSCLSYVSGFYQLPTPTLEGEKPVVEKSHSIDNPMRDMMLSERHISQLDGVTEFNESMWAVTAVIDKGALNFHTRLVIEGVDQKFGPFFQVAHLKGGMCTNIKSVSEAFWFCFTEVGYVDINAPKKLPLRLDSYKSRSETWSRPTEKVKKMIEEIKKEMEKEATHPFSLLGRTSIITNEKEFFDTEHPELLEIKNTDPERFAYMYKLAEKNHDLEITLDQAVRLGMGSSIVPDRFFFYKSFIWLHDQHDVLVCKTIEDGARKVLSAPLALCSFVFDVPRVAWKDFQIKKKMKLDLVRDHVTKTKKTPNSCFNWAFDKLKMIDVETPTCIIDKFVTLSTLYANKPILRCPPKTGQWNKKPERPRKARSLSVCEQPQGLPEGYSLVLPRSMGLTVMSSSKAVFLFKIALLHYLLASHQAVPAVLIYDLIWFIRRMRISVHEDGRGLV